MKKEMLINVLQNEECRIAILENGVLEELYVERFNQESYVGNIYKGKVVNIEPSIQAAFVDFGVGRNGFLHISDLEPTYFRPGQGGEPRREGHGRGEPRREESRREEPRREESRREEPRRDRVERPREAAPSPPPPRPAPQPAASPPSAPAPAPSSFFDGLDDLFTEPVAPAPVAAAPAPVVEEKAPAVPLTALPGTGIEEEEEKKPRRRSRSGTRRKAAPASEAASEAPPEPPAPLMDSAERRTDAGDEAGFGGGDLDDLLFFPPAPPSPLPPQAEKLPPSPEPNSDPREETAAPAGPARSVEPPRRPRRPADMPRSIEDALEADLAEADISPGPREDRGPRAEREPRPQRESRPEREPRPQREPRPEREPREPRPEREPREHRSEREPREPRPEREPREHRSERDELRRPPIADFDDEDDFDEGGSRGSRGDRRNNGRRGRDGQRREGGRPPLGRPRPLIQDVLKRGQEVIVQVIKEGIGTKGPTLSTYISIPGRYLVLMPHLSRTGVSRKIEDEDQRRRLRQMFDAMKPPANMGFIMRTAAIDKNQKEVQRDLVYLSKLWQVVARRVQRVKAPCEIYQESDMVTRTIRDNFASDISTIWVDQQGAFEQAKEFMEAVMPRFADRLKFYESKEPLFDKFNIESEIARIQLKKVPLPHGGSIVIEQTEALVAIDVNSGNFRTEGGAEDTAYQMNLHAAREIARQLRLRDLGGVIVNDFIDMREEKHRRNVERALADAMRRDRARTKILRTSQFGIIEMTRQRIRPGLKRAGYVDCPHCKGNAMVKSPETMALEVMRMVQLASCRDVIKHVEAVVSLEVAEYLLNRKRAELARLEEVGQMAVTIRGVPGVPAEHNHFVCLDTNSNEVRLTGPEPPVFRPRR